MAAQGVKGNRSQVHSNRANCRSVKGHCESLNEFNMTCCGLYNERALHIDLTIENVAIGRIQLHNTRAQSKTKSRRFFIRSQQRFNHKNK